MDSPERVRLISRTLLAHGFKRNRRIIDVIAFDGEMTVAKSSVSVTLLFKDASLTLLPKLVINNPPRDAPNLVAHLEDGNFLCYANDGEFVLDPHDVPGSTVFCLGLVKQGLERAIQTRHNSEEIAAEFPQHWHGDKFYYDVAEGGKAELILARDSRAPHGFLTDAPVSDVNEQFANPKPGRVPAYVFTTERSLDFVNHERRPETLEEFLLWTKRAANVSPDSVLARMCSSFPVPTAIFVKAPNGCVGIQVDVRSVLAAQRRKGMQTILRSGAKRIPVRRFAGFRADADFMYMRNTSGKSLGGKKIALVGCGAVGGFIGKFLAQSGAGQREGTLLLLDNQRLEPGNVGRHALGVPFIGQLKAEALRDVLRAEHPTGNFHSVTSDAQRNLDRLGDFDLIVDATGEEAFSNFINAHFVKRRQTDGSPVVLHVWLAGNGAAAQGILVDDGGFACFKCLRPQHGGAWRFDPLAKDVETNVTSAACGEGSYIPYGVAAPAIAAALALQMVMDWADGDPSPRMRTMRLLTDDTNQVRDKNPEKSRNCETCRSESR